jgi:hypothetical protein
VLVRLDHVARFIVNADHGIMRAAKNFAISLRWWQDSKRSETIQEKFSAFLQPCRLKKGARAKCADPLALCFMKTAILPQKNSRTLRVFKRKG